MTERQMKQFCMKTLKQLSKIFGLDYQTIKVTWRYEKRNKGSNLTYEEYEHASININLERAETLHDLRKTCLHEMVHILTSRVDRSAYDLACFYDDGEGKAMRRQVTRDIEAVVTGLTRILEPLVFDR